jgi:hypothetical protein
MSLEKLQKKFGALEAFYLIELILAGNNFRF